MTADTFKCCEHFQIVWMRGGCSAIHLLRLDLLRGLYGIRTLAVDPGDVKVEVGNFPMRPLLKQCGTLSQIRTRSNLSSAAYRWRKPSISLLDARTTKNLVGNRFKMSTSSSSSLGITLSNGSNIAHGTGTNKKTVFSDLGFPVTMNELWPGTERFTDKALSYGGQLGLIDFDTSIRLPRHVHIASVPTSDGGQSKERFIHERILVLQGVALVEMNGEIYVIPPRTLVTIAPGVPHTWTACPPDVTVGNTSTGSDGSSTTVSDGTFLMVYEYEDPTSFRPTRQTQSMKSVDEYVECETSGLDEIRIPKLDADAVRKRCWFVYDTEVKKAD